MGHKILIVDDNRDLAENLAEILEDAGFQPTVYDDPRRAYDELKAGVYGLALLDMRMPHMDGVELYRRIKEKDPAITAIAMTAYSRDEFVHQAVQEGVSAVVSKPVQLDALLTRIGTIAHGRKALVVEDDVDLAHNVVDILTERGLAARAVHSCQEARAYLASSCPAVLMVDIRLPDGSGVELMNEAAASCPDAIKVLISAYARDLGGLLHDATGGGVTFFEKPLDLPQLLALVETPRTRTPA